MKKVSSVVWQFFDRLEENNRCVAVLCKLCDSEYKYFGNTTNLRAHLIKKHPIQWEFRQNNSDVHKSLEESGIRTVVYDVDDGTNQSTIGTRRRKYPKGNNDKNVCYSLSIKNSSSGTTEEDSMPRIEIQRVDVLENKLDDVEENEEDEATHHLVRQMHHQASDEEWLEDDYQRVEMYEPKRKRVKYAKVKREVVTPTRRTSNYFVRSSPKSEKTEQVIIEDARKDEYSVFGEYIANKLRKFKTPRTRGNIQQLITTILWQAEYGMFDSADSVKRVLMSTVQQDEQVEESNVQVVHEVQVHHDGSASEDKQNVQQDQSIEIASEEY